MTLWNFRRRGHVWRAPLTSAQLSRFRWYCDVRRKLSKKLTWDTNIWYLRGYLFIDSQISWEKQKTYCMGSLRFSPVHKIASLPSTKFILWSRTTCNLKKKHHIKFNRTSVWRSVTRGAPTNPFSVTVSQWPYLDDVRIRISDEPASYNLVTPRNEV